MKKEILQDLLLHEELEKWVEAGILIKTVKNGEEAWKENPEFKKKSVAEQEETIKRIGATSPQPEEK
jgi:hypothetical protein